MNDADPTGEQNPTPQPVPEKQVTVDDLSLSGPEELTMEEQPQEKEINLNELFPDAETDLNDLFPDEEVKHLLKSITKNKKDMSTIKERLTTENEIPKNQGEELADDSLVGS